MATQLFQSKAPHGSPAWFYDQVNRAAPGDTVRVILTPVLAAELLKQNPHNRSMRNAKYAQLLDDVRSGRWVFNGEPILISAEGLLNDGQHRCTAVVEANTPIDVNMTFGLSRDSRVTVNQGAPKGTSDFLQMDSVPNASLVAAIGRLVIAYERTGGTSQGDGSKVSAGSIIERFAYDKHMAISATFASTMHRHSRRFAAPAIIGMCHLLFTRADPADAETYMRQVCMGESIKQKDPAFAVREGLLRDRLSRNEKIHLIFQGWNRFRNRKPLQLAKVHGNLPAII